MAVNKSELIRIIICPHCLSDKLKKASDILECQHCHNTYPWPSHSSPQLTVASRVSENKKSSHTPSKGTDLTLDVGAGFNRNGKLNIDIRPLEGIDVVCNAINMPFRDNTFNKVMHNQVLEHFPYQGSLALLKEIYRVLKPGGIIEFWVPNFQGLGILQAWLTSPICEYDPTIPTIYPPLSGVQDYYENVHLSHWNKKLVGIYAKTAQFKIIQNKTEQEYLPQFRFMKYIVWAMPNRRGQIHFIGQKPLEPV